MRIGVEASSLSLPVNGVARVVVETVSEMVNLEPTAEFTLYSPRPLQVSPEVERCRIRHGSLASYCSGSLWTQRCLPRWLEEDRIEAFWGHNYFLPVRVRRAVFRLLTVHDLIPLRHPRLVPFRSWLMARLLTKATLNVADCVTAGSEAAARELLQQHPAAKLKTRIVPWGPAAPIARPPGDRALSVAADLCGEIEHPVLYVGGAAPRKGLDIILKALQQCGRPVRAVVVGDVRTQSRNLARELARAEQAGLVRLAGTVSDEVLAALYRSCRLLVLPSRCEGFGLPVVEAMHCGCPVLCSDDTSLREVGGGAVRWFRAGDATDLAHRMTAMLTSPDLLATMADQGRARAAQFTFRDAARKMLAIVRAGLEEAP